MVPIDPIKALAAKRASLVSYKRKLQEECDRQIREVDSDIASIDSALEVVRKAVEPYLCKAAPAAADSATPQARWTMYPATPAKARA